MKLSEKIIIELSNIPYYLIQYTVCKIKGHRWEKAGWFGEVCSRCYVAKSEVD